MQVFMRPPRLMLRNLIDLSEESTRGSYPPMLDVQVTALYSAMTFAMLTLTYGASASLGVFTPVLQVPLDRDALLLALVRMAGAWKWEGQRACEVVPARSQSSMNIDSSALRNLQGLPMDCYRAVFTLD
jgi:hypothetical protein